MRAFRDSFIQQVTFWGGIGPFLILLTIFVGFIRFSPEFTFLALSGLVGLAICFKWGQEGLLGAIGCVILALIVTSTSYENDFLWNFGMAWAVILGLIITALSLEESADLIRGVQVEAESRLTNLYRLDEKLKKTQTTAEEKKRELREALQSTQSNLQETQGQLDSTNRFNQILYSDFQSTHVNLDNIQKDHQKLRYFSSQQAIAFKEAKEEVEQLSRMVANQDGTAYETYSVLERKIDVLKERLAFSQPLSIQLDQQLQEKDREIKKINGMLNQLRQQFQDKCNTLDLLRKQFFEVEGESLLFQEKYQEILNREPSEESQKMEDQLQKTNRQYENALLEIDELYTLVSQLSTMLR